MHFKLKCFIDCVNAGEGGNVLFDRPGKAAGPGGEGGDQVLYLQLPPTRLRPHQPVSQGEEHGR